MGDFVVVKLFVADSILTYAAVGYCQIYDREKRDDEWGKGR